MHTSFSPRRDRNRDFNYGKVYLKTSSTQPKKEFKTIYGFHRYMLQSRDIAKRDLNQFHRTFLKNKCSDYINTISNFFLTNTSDQTKNSNTNINTNTHTQTHTYTKTLSTVTCPNLKKQIPKPSPQPSLQLTVNPDQYNQFRTFCGGARQFNPYSIRDFINDRRIIRKAKIQKECLIEKLISFEEEKNLLQKEEPRITQFHSENHVRLLNLFLLSMTRYVKFLFNQISIEREKLSDLYNIRFGLEKYNQNLQYMISKKEAMLSRFKDIKKFLLMVRFQVHDVNLLPIKEKVKYGLIPLYKQKGSPKEAKSRKSVMFNNPKSFRAGSFGRKSFALQQRRSINLKTIEELQAQTGKKNEEEPNFNQKIFESVDEFCQVMSNLEHRTFKLFKFINEQTETLKRLNEEKNEEIGYQERLVREEEEGYEKSERRLLNAKKYNEELNNKYRSLQKSSKDSNIMQQLKERIVRNLLKLPLNLSKYCKEEKLSEKLSSRQGFILVEGTKHDKVMFSLSLLEKIIVDYVVKMKKYDENARTHKAYQECKNSVEKQKRKENSIQKLSEEEEKRKRMYEKIMERTNRIYFKQYRIVPESPVFKIKKIKKKKETQSGQNNLSDYENYLSF